MTGTRNPSRKYFKRNQPYFYKSVDNWEEWDTDESYDRTFFIGIDDSNPEDIDVALYMIWGGKPIAVVGSKVLDTVSGVVDTAVLLEEEIQSILEEVQELTAAVAQARVDIEEAITEMGALVDRCEGILEGAEAARDLAREWATKIDGMVEEDGEPVDYSAKYYSYAAKDSENAAAGSATTASDDADLAEAWATKMDGTVDGSEYSSKYYAGQSAGNAATAVTKAGEASGSATLASKWATQLTTPVEGSEYSAKQYAQNAWTSAQNAGTSETNANNSAGAASGSATAASDSATLAQEWATKMDGQVASTDYSSKYYASQSATCAQDAQDALDSVNGLIATPIGTVFQSIYVDEALDIARRLDGQLILSTKFTGFRAWLDTVQAYNPNLFTTEENWQAEKALSKFGQCGKFVIDDTAGTIRLPCVVNAQGLLGLSGIGNLVNESLPNITGAVSNAAGDNSLFNQAATTGSGCLEVVYADNQRQTAVTNDRLTLNQSFNLNASRSSSTYQDNAPVQQEAVQYPYYIQVATGVEETLPAIREYNINTPFFFGQSMYSDVAPDNASWLVSNGQYNAKTVYPDYYDWLLEKRNSNTKTFYLWKNLSGDTGLFLTETNTLSVGSALYGYNPTIKFGEITAISGNNVTVRNDVANTTDTMPVNISNPTYAGNLPVYDSSKMNVISKNDLDNWNIPTNTSDYDFVINTADQTFRLPLIAERVLVAKKEPTAEDNTWYNLYSDGWLEQGGVVANTGANHVATISLLKPYADTNYIVTTGQANSAGAKGVADVGQMGAKTTSSFQSYQYNDVIINWQTCGYAPIPTQSDFTEVAGLYYYVGDTVQDASLINAGAVLGQLATKTNSVEAAAASMPSTRYINLTLQATGAEYTAPANGYFSWKGQLASGSNGGWIYIGLLESTGIPRLPAMQTPASNVQSDYAVFVPCAKGDKISLAYGGIIQNQAWRFIYAKGDE